MCGVAGFADGLGRQESEIPEVVLEGGELAAPQCSGEEGFDFGFIGRTEGGVASFVTSQTQLILDTNGYFAP